MGLSKKKNWSFYLLRFVMFAVAFFMVDLFIAERELGYAVISGLVSGVILTVLWWFFDQAHGQIKGAVKEEEEDRRRKEQK
ncbi:MAG: hypothetical protein J5882_03500 [Bacteroidales bacterium]|nr:hypothetical protein [Bacteroidales bacterium]